MNYNSCHRYKLLHKTSLCPREPGLEMKAEEANVTCWNFIAMLLLIAFTHIPGHTFLYITQQAPCSEALTGVSSKMPQ